MDRRQAFTTEIGHANRAKAGTAIFLNRKDRHDVRVLHLGERLGFISFDGGNLQHHRPIRKVGVFGQEDFRE